MKKIIAVSYRMKNGVLDDYHTLYDTGEILHEYDKSIYPGGQDFSETLSIDFISLAVKERLLSAASGENKELVRSLLGMNE